MATEAQQPLKDTRVAAADLSGHQYRFVKLDANGDVVAIAAAGEVAYGVLQNDPGLGEAAELVLIGITKVSADAALTPGAVVTTSIDGQAAVSALGNARLGNVRVGAAAAGQIATIAVNTVAPAIQA